MAETNGSGRLDRIEAILEALAENQQAIQQQHNDDFKKVMTWQVLMQEKFERMAEKQERTDKRMAETDERIQALVSAIGEFIRKV